MYRVKPGFKIDVGFSVNSSNIRDAAILTNEVLKDLPATLYKCIDFKTVSSVIGAVFCDALASKCKCIVNPIEKGHPDLIPATAAGASEAKLRNYPQGLEIKSTVGNIKQGANLRAGQKRVSLLTGITWQAHHREVHQLLGLVWDFAFSRDSLSFEFPGITGAFYSDDLVVGDWGEISGTTGRNTKVTGMRASGKAKMGNGWIVLIDDPVYLQKFRGLLGVIVK